MKTIIIVVVLIALASGVQAQRKITLNDVINGKTVLQIAKDHAVEAFIETKAIYKPEMTESAFVNECLKNFPKEYYSFREVFVPYAAYLYSFHSRGLSEVQVRNLVTGKEYIDCTNGVLSWQQANPGINPVKMPWWKFMIHWAAVVLTAIDEHLN